MVTLQSCNLMVDFKLNSSICGLTERSAVSLEYLLFIIRIQNKDLKIVSVVFCMCVKLYWGGFIKLSEFCNCFVKYCAVGLMKSMLWYFQIFFLDGSGLQTSLSSLFTLQLCSVAILVDCGVTF